MDLAVGLTEDLSKEYDFEEKLDKAVKHALDTTEAQMTSISKRKILEELSEMEIRPDSLGELIKRTETFQTSYCTQKDAKEIIFAFERNFRKSVAQSPPLASLFTLSYGTVTLEKLKSINEILTADDKKLDKIKQQVSEVRGWQVAVREFVQGFINSIAFILVAMAVFLGMGIICAHTFDRSMLIIAPACYGASEFLSFFLDKKSYLSNPIHRTTERKDREGMKRVRKVILEKFDAIIITLLLAISCFWIVILATEVQNVDLPFLTLSLALGSITSQLLKKSTSAQKASVGQKRDFIV